MSLIAVAYPGLVKGGCSVRTRNFAHAQIVGRCGFECVVIQYIRVKKNVSKNVRYRFVKRYLPCGFVAVFDSRAIRF